MSDPVNVIYGTFILYVGWISFNCSGTYGLTSGRENLAARVGVVTCIGGAAGTGAGFCRFDYQREQQRLSVVTVPSNPGQPSVGRVERWW